jgi:hypothetical protein
VLLLLPLLVGIGLQPGCGNREEINTYSVDKSASSSPSDSVTPQVTATEARLLGAIIPREDQTWFFKVTGPPEVLDKQAETFREFIESVRFPADEPSQPTWDLPANWQREAGSGMRFATLRVDSPEGPLELSVIPLRSPAQEESEYLLQNINLWRNQLGLAAITQEQLAAETEQLQLDGTTATLVNYVGQLIPHGVAPGHGARQMAAQVPGHPPIGQPGQPSPAGQSSQPDQPSQPSPLVYDKPESWTESEVSGMRKAAFTVTDGDRQAEITVIDLSASAGDLLANVNRWREQIQLDPTTQSQLDETVEQITIDESSADYVELFGPDDAEPRQAIIGAVLSNADRTWFFKLAGPAELVRREKERFRSFLESVQFRSASGEVNGN